MTCYYQCGCHMHLSKYTASTEAVAYQRDNSLHSKLSETLKDTKNFSEKAVEKAIFDGCGLTVILDIDPSECVNAYVKPPVVDRNHPFFKVLFQNSTYDVLSSHDDLIAELKKDTNAVFESELDLKNARVSGFFSTLRIEMAITKGLLFNTYFTAGEKAAIILHEIGHVMSMFEFVGWYTSTNAIIYGASKVFFEVPDAKIKFRLSNAIQETNQMTDAEMDALKKSTPEVFRNVLLRRKLERFYSSMGSETHDITGWESASDQFATRMGAGRDLFTGLSKMYEGSSSTYSLPRWLLYTFGCMLAWGFLLMVSWPMALLIVFTNPAKKMYDDPEERLRRVRNETMGFLKSANLSVDLRKQYQTDIELMDSALKQFTDRRGIIELFHTTINPWGRSQHKQTMFQRDLEQLMANPLYLSANKMYQGV